MDSIDPLILTARFDPLSAAWFQALRDRYFPPERNIVPAHLTLFHALPGADFAAIDGELRRLERATAPMGVKTAGFRFLGRGVAVTIAAPALVETRSRLAAAWANWLTPQDRQGFRPHVTVQNKVDALTARQTHARLVAEMAAAREGQVIGLDLWHYRAGPWEAAAAYAFEGPSGAAVDIPR